jgi:hypothetical protein
VDYDKLDMRLQLPSDFKKYGLLLPGSNQTEIQLFFRNIIWDGFKNPRSLYREYKTKSWAYPRYIFFLILVSLVMSAVILLAFAKTGLVVIIAFYVCITIVWILYGLELRQLLRGSKTIDYFCWGLLPYRVRLLNNYKIRPVFFSTSFQRYYNALDHVLLLKRIQGSGKARKFLDLSNGKHQDLNLDSLVNALIKGKNFNKDQEVFMKLLKSKKDKIIKQLKNKRGNTP